MNTEAGVVVKIDQGMLDKWQPKYIKHATSSFIIGDPISSAAFDKFYAEVME